MAIRNGRFKGSAASGITIISGRSGMFRVFNSGTTSFTVNPGGGGSAVTVPVDCSVDVNVINDCVVQAGGDVEGIYEFIGTSQRIRSGRFKGTAAAPVTIVQDAANEDYYRLLNSGSTPINVVPSGTILQPTFSLDVSTNKDITVAGSNIECIYERLHEDQDTRSGRFKFVLPLPATNPFPHRIIDLRGGSARALYRIYNSGPTPILIQEGNSAGAGSLVGVVAPQNSLDFEANNKDIYVRPDDNGDGLIDPAGDNTQPIEGSFDFIAPA